MGSNTLRGVAAAILSIALVPTAFPQAQAAPAPTPGQFTGTPTRGLVSRQGQLPASLKDASLSLRAAALGRLGESPTTSTLITPGITRMGSFCPAGQSPNAVYGYESLEAGLPFPLPTGEGGFTVATGAGAPDGSSWAKSSLLASDPALVHFVASNYAAVPQTGKVYLSFSYRGAFIENSAAALFNDGFAELAPSPQWATVSLDITAEATTAIAGNAIVDVGFGHRADTTPGSFEVDDVALYTCASPPNSGVRGDWTGQGTVDLMAASTDGSLWVYEGKGTGAVGSAVKVGFGWSAFTWQGSPGDVNGDRRTDLLARNSDGTLWFYPGKGNGALGSGVKVGSGWNPMTSIATPGDFDLDGRPDLLSRRSDGTLHLYRVLATGGLRYVKQVGVGWKDMRSIIGMGDLNGDKRGDVVAVRGDGVMFSYLSSGTDLTSAKQVGYGWKNMNLLTSPGDMNKDGRGDLIARRSDGTLWFYPGRTGGGVNSGKQVGSQWGGMLRVL